ncbi:hypothetical protein BDW02DRAFT_595765 [Decorospora gaudefroyi]|uniref:Aminoglycoside phosphotransferase domain-containing protein n=1 Tax=Decorospora gaudefroyi TaxID=184978 RepID=A0A6A5KQ97_9PLEO|nr:hypothetical protein BDW02DRAFT_595765 [Decorospora gaudefroyi]
MNHNHANFQARLDFIRNLLLERFGADASTEAKIDPIQYDPDSPFKYNNFVYRITLPSPPSAAGNNNSHEPRQPGTTPLPADSKAFIMRLTNPDAEGMHAHARVENEVAVISLAAAALSGFKPHVIPSVRCCPEHQLANYLIAWLSGKRKASLPRSEILKALQDFQLPSSIEQYGGVTFDGAGQIVSTAMTSVGSGPWHLYEDCFRDRLERALRQADVNPYIRGWHANGVRKRLEAFVESGVPAQFKALESRDDKTIFHADFTPDNLLYDASTQRITALIDYDFACILHPSYEFLRSFSGAGGQFQAGRISNPMAKMWEEELERLDVWRPRTMGGISTVADVDAVLRCILPWRVTNSDVLRMQSEAVIRKCRDENEAQLVGLLRHLGF